jgi:hypothetical protein
MAREPCKKKKAKHKNPLLNPLVTCSIDNNFLASWVFHLLHDIFLKMEGEFKKDSKVKNFML